MSDTENSNHHHDLFGNETSIVAFETPKGSSGGLSSDSNKYGIIPLMIVIFLLSFLFVGFLIYCSKRQEAKKRKAAAETLEQRQRMREVAASKLALPEVGHFVGVADATESTMVHLDVGLDVEEAGSLLTVSSKGVSAQTETNGKGKVVDTNAVTTEPMEKEESLDQTSSVAFRSSEVLLEAGSTPTTGIEVPSLEPKNNVMTDTVGAVTNDDEIDAKADKDESVDKNPKVRLLASNMEEEEINPADAEEKKKKRKLVHVGDFGTLLRTTADEATTAKLPAVMNDPETPKHHGKEDNATCNKDSTITKQHSLEKVPDTTHPSSLDTEGPETLGTDETINQEDGNNDQNTDLAANPSVTDSVSPAVDERINTA